MRTTYLLALFGVLTIAVGCPSEDPQDDDTSVQDDDDGTPADDDDTGDDDDTAPSMPGPTDEQVITLEGGGGSFDVETALYTGWLDLPGVSASEDVVLWSALGGEVQPDAEGLFEIRMNSGAAGIILSSTASGDPIAMDIFAAHPDLVDVNPILSPRSTAVSMVYLTLAPDLDDPRLHAVLMGLVDRLPAIDDLAQDIETGLAANSSYLMQPSPDLGVHVLQALRELEALAAAAANRDSFILPCDADILDTYLQHDLVDRADCVAVDPDIDPYGLTGSIGVENYYPRWVALYMDETDATEFDVTCLAQDATCELVGLIPPATMKVPELSELLVAELMGVGGWIADLFGGEELAEGICTVLAEQLSESFYNTTQRDYGSYDLTWFAGGTLSTYSFGQIQSTDGDFRHLLPGYLTAFTMVGEPLIGLWADVESEQILNLEGYDLLDLLSAAPTIAGWAEYAIVVGEACHESEDAAECIQAILNWSADFIELPFTAIVMQQYSRVPYETLEGAFVGLGQWNQLVYAAIDLANIVDGVVGLANIAAAAVLMPDMMIEGDIQDRYRFYLDDLDGDGYLRPEVGGDDCRDDDAAIHPGTSEACHDLQDNDCDAQTDCNDPDCAIDPACQAPCGNGVDDDGDGWIDLDDPGCGGDPLGGDEGGCGFSYQCNDCVDNDGDGYIDHMDADCAGQATGIEFPPPEHCSDGLDNDGDTLIDLIDPDCTSYSPWEPIDLVGAVWTYSTTLSLYDNGVVVQDTGTETIEVTDRTYSPIYEVFVLTEQFIGPGIERECTRYYGPRYTGNAEYGYECTAVGVYNEEAEFVPEVTYLPYNPDQQVGNNWSNVYTSVTALTQVGQAPQNSNFSHSLESSIVGMETLTVPAGLFNVIHVHWEYEIEDFWGPHEGYVDAYWAADIGLVKWDEQRPSEMGQYVLKELISYQVP